MRDWFDDYLDGMNEYKIVNVAPDSIIGKKKPELNILQKKMHWEAALQNEREMRLLREKEEEELTSASGGDSDSPKRQSNLLPSGYVTLAGLTWAPIQGTGTYAGSQSTTANFTGLGFPAGTWRSATAAELQSLALVLPVATAQSVLGWVFTNNFNIWSSESGRIVNLNTGANNGTSNTNNFNVLPCKTPA